MTSSLPPVEAVWTAGSSLRGVPAEGRLPPRAADGRRLVARHHRSRPGGHTQEQGEEAGRPAVGVTYDL